MTDQLDVISTGVGSVSGVLSSSSFEEFRKDTFLLLVHVLTLSLMNTETLALDRVVELALACGCCILGAVDVGLFVATTTGAATTTTVLTAVFSGARWITCIITGRVTRLYALRVLSCSIG